MYEGDDLGCGEAGQFAACQRAVQTHITQCGGFYVDGFRIAQNFQRDASSVVGRGGGTFANHSTVADANAELFLEEEGASLNKIFLRARRLIKCDEEITICYGSANDKSYLVAMGRARYELSSGGDGGDGDDLSGGGGDGGDDGSGGGSGVVGGGDGGGDSGGDGGDGGGSGLGDDVNGGGFAFATGQAVEAEYSPDYWSVANVISTKLKARKALIEFCCEPQRPALPSYLTKKDDTVST